MSIWRYAMRLAKGSAILLAMLFAITLFMIGLQVLGPWLIIAPLFFLAAYILGSILDE